MSCLLLLVAAVTRHPSIAVSLGQAAGRLSAHPTQVAKHPADAAGL